MSESSKGRERQRPGGLIVLGVAVVAAILVPFFLFDEAIEGWTRGFIEQSRGEPLLVALVLGGLLAGDIVLPTPSSLISTACGSCLGFVLGTVVSFVGMTLSAVAGYLIGRGASGWAERQLKPGELDLLQRMHSRWGVWMLAAVRPVPVLAEASVLFAGVARMPWQGALPLVLISNLGVSLCYAAIGALASGSDAGWLAFVAAALLSGAAMLMFRPRNASEK